MSGVVSTFLYRAAFPPAAMEIIIWTAGRSKQTNKHERTQQAQTGPRIMETMLKTTSGRDAETSRR